MKRRLSFLFLPILIFLFGCNQEKTTLIDYVDPFIGTDGHGHTYPGAALPFGMVQLSPDTRKDSWDGCSGYHYSDQTIMGFSHTHLSGTGVGDYGDIRMMPTVGEIQLNPGMENDPASGYRSSFSHKSEVASPGYYKVELDDYGIEVELTVGKRMGLHKYTFPASAEANVIIDLVEGVTSDKINELGITVNNNRSLSGHRFTSGWAVDQRIYFYMEFSELFTKFGIFNTGEEHHEISQPFIGNDTKAWVQFNTSKNKTVLVKVGISSVSEENARLNVLDECPEWDFEFIKNKAENEWSRELSKIEVKGGNKEQKTTFYTALYHSLLNPNLFSDTNGEYRGHDAQIHHSENKRYTVFSLWDTFRAAHPLLTIIKPDIVPDLINTMLDIYDKGGLLPVWELAGNETNCMIGYHSIPVIADAYFKGIKGIDYDSALLAMVKSADADHFGLKYYKDLGYIPADKEGESVSKTLEYAYDDWCIAQMALGLGHQELYERFILRAQNYKNILDPETGFMRGKMNGSFVAPFDPTQVNFMLTEANTWQYTFFVPHDISGLMFHLGGNENFTQKLDELFYTDASLSGRTQSDITGLIGQYAHGNEPSHHMAYLYNYSGYPDKAVPVLRKIMNELYTSKPDGLCGNEDCGQMSAWYVMSAMGFYPVCPGDNNYIIGSPLFEEVEINLDGGKKFVIKANNLSRKNIYIQSVKLNGSDYNKSYFTHQTLIEGGVIEFEMGSEPSNWGTQLDAVPTSEIRREFLMPVPYFIAESNTFTDSLKIQLADLNSNRDLKIYYTLDGSEPTANSKLFVEPIFINQSITVKAKAYLFDKISSKVATAEYKKIAGGRKVTVKNPYSSQYTAGGDIALINSIRGGENFRTGAWQGYYGVDFEAVVDLGEIQEIHELSAGFLQEQKSWIWMPDYVEFSVSENGSDFTGLSRIENDVNEKADGGIIKEFGKKGLQLKGRYVKVFAKNKSVCPEWHVGAGNKAWVFVDEISVN